MDRGWRLVESRSNVVYRIQGLPPNCSKDYLRTTLNDAFSLREEGFGVQVHSLVASADRESEKVATITAPLLTERLGESRNEWDFEVLAKALTPKSLDTSSVRVRIDTHFQGFTAFSSPSGKDHMVDCIALSGFNDHAFNSFKARGLDHMWLRDDLLGDLKGARILLYGYDVKIADRDSVQDLEGLSSTFRRALLNLGREQGQAFKPLIFIAHSLGGLVLKETFIQLSRDTEYWAHRCLESTYGMLLFGCPNQGMDVASLLPLCQGEANKAFVLGLRQISERLRQICRDFPKAFAFRDSRIISFYETRLSPTAIEDSDGVWSMNGPHAILVPEASATHGRPGENEAHDIQAINSTHSEMIKFNVRDPTYQLVLGFLREFTALAPSVIEARLEAHNVSDGNEAQLDLETVELTEALVQWLAPRGYNCNHYEDDLFTTLSSRHSGTCNWIYRKELFIQWLSCKTESHSSLLWLHAIPGAGKTVLASYIIHNLLCEKEKSSSTDGQEIFYFFFNNADIEKNSPIAAARALVHQLLLGLQLRKRRKAVEELGLIKRKSGQSRAMGFRSLWNFFSLHCKHLASPIIVIDALDECEQVNMLLSELHTLTRDAPVRIFVTSRREADIVKSLDHLQQLAMSPEDVHEDIRAFLEHRVRQSPRLSHALVKSRITRILNMRSKGMFLWVVLMLEELESKQSIVEVEEMLASPLPQDLNAVYSRILIRLNATLKSSQKRLCEKVLKWTALAKRPLQVSEILEALRFEYTTGFQDTFLLDTEYTEKELQLVCGSLVIFRNRTIQLLHLSTRDFLLTESDPTLPTHSFLVDLGRDSLRLTEICIKYISTAIAPEAVSNFHSNSAIIEAQYPLARYICFHWLSHIVQSLSKAVFELGPTLVPFLTTRRSLTWVEMCLSFEPNFISHLTMDVQSLLYWSTSDVFDREGPSQETMALVRYWAESCLTLLTEYGSELENRPFEIYSIDPKCIFAPSQYSVNENLSAYADYDYHSTLVESDILRLHPPLPQPPPHRTLQRHTSSSTDYALFFLHKRNNAFVTVDREAGSLPRLHCQEASSGRRLLPVCDTEFGDDSDCLVACGTARSNLDNYVGIVYEVKATGPYLAIWRIHENLDFEGDCSKPWAHKVFSHFMDDHLRVLAAQPIIFDHESSVYCPAGCYDLKTGVLNQSFDHIQKRQDLRAWHISFCNFGSTLVSKDFLDIVIMSSLGIETERITHSESGGMTLEVVCQSGDYFVGRGSQNSHALFLYDVKSRTKKELAHFGCSKTTYEVSFEDKDRMIIIMICTKADTGFKDRFYVYIYIAAQSEWYLAGTRELRSHPAGYYLDASNRTLYIVSGDRTWYRLDVSNKNLSYLDSEEDYVFSRKQVCQPSEDGRRLGILQEKEQSYELFHIIFDPFSIRRTQVLDDGIAHDTDISEDLVTFSPNLDWLLIGKTVTNLTTHPATTMKLPIRPLQGSIATNTIDAWRVKFSSCGRYVVVATGLSKSSRYATDLHVFALQETINECLQCYHIDTSANNTISMNDITFDMHPHAPEVIVKWLSKLSGQKVASGNLMQIEVIDLDARPPRVSGLPTVYKLGFYDPSSILQSQSSSIKYSPTGDYVFTTPAYEEPMFWEIPGRPNCSNPPFPKVLKATPSLCDLMSFNALSMAIYSATGDRSFLASGEVRNKAVKRLTLIPKRLQDAQAYFILGDGDNPDIRILFCRDDGPPEMRVLRMRLNEYVDKLKEWRLHEEKECDAMLNDCSMSMYSDDCVMEDVSD